MIVWSARRRIALVEKKGEAKDRFYGKLILDLGSEVRSSVEQGTAAMEKLVEKLENTNEAIDVLIEDEKSPLSEPIMPPKFCTYDSFCYSRPRMIKESVWDAGYATSAVERGKASNVKKLCEWILGQTVNSKGGLRKTESGFFESVKCAEGKKTVNQMPWTEMKQLMTIEFYPIEEIQRMKHELWNLKIKECDIVVYTQRFNELALMCPRMVEPERVKVDAYIRGLTDNIKGEVTSYKPANLNEAVRMAHKLMKQKSQARNERILEGKKRKKNDRAMVTAPTDGKLPLCERCFTRHVGQCTIKCHKCGKVGHKASQGHTRNRCPKKVKQEEVREVRGRAYAIKDAEPKVNHIFEIDLMPIELGTFDVIIGMDWLVKHDAIIVCGKKVARKYVEQGCHLFLWAQKRNVTKEESVRRGENEIGKMRGGGRWRDVGFPQELSAGTSLPKGGENIIMVNVIPPDHDHDVPVVEPNQHDDAPVVPEPVLEDEDEDPEEDEFEEEEDPQEDEDDMEIDIEEDKNEPELTYPYEEVDPLNPLPPASESEPDDEIEVENPIEHEDATVPVSVYEIGESSTAAIAQEDGDRLLHGFMRWDIDSLFGRMVNFSRRLCGRETAHALVEKKGEAKDRFYGKLILDLGNEVCSSVEQGTAAMEKLVEKLGNVEKKTKCKKLKKELEEAWLKNTFLRMQNERVERDLYWTRVRAHEFYQDMIYRGFLFEERPNEAIDVSIKDEKSPLSELRGSPPDV
ncbi:putative reverse transcriptase domain-containing protein [Tanacetum coccineum]|uniref:Reverse transcriptase domain-containing protein n=1 Tax=Tanacetum coccineum TaxID=301880 RepID=A0ABQ5DL31_9ASTR